MAAQQVLLQGQDFVRLDALVGQFAEAGIDAIDRGPVASESFRQRRERSTLLAAADARLQAFDLAVQDALGVVQGQAVAGQFQGRRRCVGSTVHRSRV